MSIYTYKNHSRNYFIYCTYVNTRSDIPATSPKLRMGREPKIRLFLVLD
jgi:hypothetical protein